MCLVSAATTVAVLSAWHLEQHRKARMLVQPASPCGSGLRHREIAFPVARHGTIFRLRRPLAD